MLTLAFESSARAASVALCRDGALIGQYAQCAGLTHSRTLLPMAEDLLKNTETAFSDVDVLAVAHGPGSFTGIRIGVSTVKGLAWASGKPAVGVSALEAMAWHGLAAGEGALVCCAMDARRDQIYNALFEISGETPRRLCPDRALGLADLAAELKQAEKNIFLVGDGARLCYNTLRGQGIRCFAAPEPLLNQSAWGVCMAAAGKQPGDAADLLPVYLRLSQAERERQAKLEK
ncbi:MAG TPA: tRNA (adenosine(37)-N6)-threonylcarbamoyltransferase complex dimerization subunit type 1 TsaB [Clostridiales bacterium]|nr:tRNA (adenosine(37)-N6)-threonylcarbamoyltransferase complex dimerization subunit type 1 TsaB [Clostridiales bacterium]HBR08738.1 tRNA (adenosine(37)-N6)-threonylcarbamoyltransferase complex dimerization subunit type 1 TsaB [Clostridiales bacterium]